MNFVFHPAGARTRNQRAMTLLEMMMAVSIGGLVLAAVSSLLYHTTRSFAAIGNYNDLDNASRNALDVLSRDVRQARGLTAFTTNQIRLQSNDSNVLTYTYSPSTLRLTRQIGTQPAKVMLEECDYLNFAIYQRNPSNGWTWYPVKSNLLATTKLIDVSWKCSRQILGKRVNTESVQTAKFVIRN
jgi:prepilin-type N-terminal cleavage/methylation domain-containing protein